MTRRPQLVEAEPIIISGTTGTGARYAQWWCDAVTAGIKHKQCVAQYSELKGDRGLFVLADCPDDLLLKVLHGYPFWKDGGVQVQATHTVEWVFSKPIFTEVES